MIHNLWHIPTCAARMDDRGTGAATASNITRALQPAQSSVGALGRKTGRKFAPDKGPAQLTPEASQLPLRHRHMHGTSCTCCNDTGSDYPACVDRYGGHALLQCYVMLRELRLDLVHFALFGSVRVLIPISRRHVWGTGCTHVFCDVCGL
ncbi:hypothetical protein EVAR_70975_1 [Eumeta japonica]|uniref:Uncharacterized protein n=1 Tax=Eumeta variegata TaxID=151549 RepID=A0A4C2A7G8_EUMVA|nr:hypothetical protein EVAR_70975_1 [Eumeta japonica]